MNTAAFQKWAPENSEKILINIVTFFYVFYVSKELILRLEYGLSIIYLGRQ